MSTRSDRPARTWPASVAWSTASLALALSIVPTHAAGGDIYRVAQPDGTVVFTDRPAPDATLVESRPLNVVGPVGGGRATPSTNGSSDVTSGAYDGDRSDDDSTGPSSDERETEDDVTIERVEIASPPPDATIIDPVGPLLVEVGTAPGSLAASGLVAEAVVDGEVVASGASSIAVPPLDRGEHALAVRLVDADGHVVVESATQALYVRRTFVRPSEETEP